MYSVAQPLTNALTTLSHEPVPAAYCVSAVPTPFFQFSDGMDEKFELTDVLPSAIYSLEMATRWLLAALAALKGATKPISSASAAVPSSLVTTQ